MEKLLVLTEEEIEIIKTGIFVGQHECQLPETEDSDVIRNLLEKLDAEPETFIDGAMDSPLLNKQNKEYTPTCPQGYSDCVCDPAYIKYHYPDWYKRMYGDMTPEEASKERCSILDVDCYDDEDK